MYRLMVIDDDADAVDSLSTVYPWEKYGFTLTATFHDGQSALNWLNSHSVDLILCDIKMPGMNGIELAGCLHSLHRKEKIVFISAYKDFEYARKAMEYGVSYYCIKPVTFPEMEKTILQIRNALDMENGAAEQDPQTETREKNHNITDVKISRIRQYIQRYYAKVTLAQLAEYMQMSTSYLSSFYKEKTGEKLQDAIIEARLQEALHMLRTETCLNVAEVAEKVGYTNTISFSRSFKKRFGVPPSEVRRDFDIAEKNHEAES